MPSTAFDAAVRLLKGRSKTRARLEAALLQWGYLEPEVGEALQRVTSLGYLDDTRHAEAKARAGFAEGRALADVLRRLEAEGVDAKTALAAARAAAAEAGHDDEAAAKLLLQKRQLSGVKAARLLASRGFSEELIAKLVGDDFVDASG